MYVILIERTSHGFGCNTPPVEGAVEVLVTIRKRTTMNEEQKRKLREILKYHIIIPKDKNNERERFQIYNQR